jgi:hypothetical protein
MAQADELAKYRGPEYAAHWLASLAQDALLAALIQRGALSRTGQPDPAPSDTLASALAEIERQTGGADHG